MKINAGTILGACATLLSVGATIVSAVANEKSRDAAIERIVDQKLNSK